MPGEDCQITYAIWNGVKYAIETELFIIDALTGELKAKEMFDCEKNDRHGVSFALIKYTGLENRVQIQKHL